jgi:hypothetical protein
MVHFRGQRPRPNAVWLVLALAVLGAAQAPLRAAHATDASPPTTVAPPRDPGAAETQVFWHQRNRDHLILQQLTINNQLDTYRRLELEDTARLKSLLGAFCSPSEGTAECFSRYKRATARQLEDIKGSILRSEDEITRLRNDIPGQGGTVLVRGGAIDSGNGTPDEVKSNQTSFTPKTSGPADLNAPAYVPTLKELESLGKASQDKQLQGGNYKSNEERYIEGSRKAFTLQDPQSEQSLNEDYALFQAVKPVSGTSTGAPLNQVIRSEGGAMGAIIFKTDEAKKAKALKSIRENQSHDLQRANEAKQGAIEAMRLEEMARQDPKRTVEQKYSQEQIDAFNQARAMIINAYTTEIAKNPLPKPSSKPATPGKNTTAGKGDPKTEPEPDPATLAGGRSNARKPAQTGTPSSSTSKTPTIQARVGANEPPASEPENPSVCAPPLCNDKPVEGQLPTEGDFHIYTNPAEIDADVIDLRE